MDTNEVKEITILCELTFHALTTLMVITFQTSFLGDYVLLLTTTLSMDESLVEGYFI